MVSRKKVHVQTAWTFSIQTIVVKDMCDNWIVTFCVNFWPEVGINFELIFGLGNSNINFVMIGPAKYLPRKVFLFGCTPAIIIQCHLSDLMRGIYGYETIPMPAPFLTSPLEHTFENMATVRLKQCFPVCPHLTKNTVSWLATFWKHGWETAKMFPGL